MRPSHVSGRTAAFDLRDRTEREQLLDLFAEARQAEESDMEDDLQDIDAASEEEDLYGEF